MLKQCTCAQCGKTFERQDHHIVGRTFCSKNCYREFIIAHREDIYGAKHPMRKRKQIIKKPPKEYRKCYMKEARAMLQGKNWKGKNKCVKLPEE